MLVFAGILAFAFVAVGFGITSHNARYLLSGYNTLSEEEQLRFDLKEYLRLFRRFHIFLAISLLFGCLILGYAFPNAASLFLVVYPLLAYAGFILWSRQKGFQGISSPKSTRLAVFLVLTIASAIAWMLWKDMRSSELELARRSLAITGSFGVEVQKADVQNAGVVNELPAIRIRTGGLSAGNYAKGSFRTKSGESVKLFVNKANPPFVRIQTKGGIIYYNHDSKAASTLAEEINEWKTDLPR